ncbi:MAG: hypothetical protein WC762_04595 [Methylobacter sp.]|jgi:hypothetical protein
MSYYPILKAPGCQGWTTLCNFSPNNWETRDATEKFVSLTWAEEGAWRTESLGVLAHGAMRTISTEEISGVIPEGVLPLLSLSTSKLSARSDSLPQIDAPRTAMPAWRATLGLSTNNALVSYQGEIDSFASPGSLLTFCPFIQFGEEIENYLIFLNMENSPVTRTSQVEIYDAENTALRRKFEVRNNDVTIIALDGLGFSPIDLPLIICREMSGIPLYFSKTCDGSFLSLEHTHPPASYVIHGQRREAQKILKNTWFSRAAQ